MNEKEFAELSAAAALDALSPGELRQYRAAVAAHPEWQRIVAADAETAGALAEAIAPVTPPDGIRSALLARIAQTPQHGQEIVEPMRIEVELEPEPTAAEIVSPRGGRRLRLLFTLAACLVLLVGVGFGAAALGGYLNPPASVVALQQIQDAADAQQATVELADGGSATAHWSASLGSAVLVTDGIATPASGETYELWFVRGDAPVSAGTFAVDHGSATAVLQGDMKPGDVIAVTVEQAGGAPGGAPTTDPVIVIPTA